MATRSTPVADISHVDRRQQRVNNYFHVALDPRKADEMASDLYGLSRSSRASTTPPGPQASAPGG